MDGFLSSDFVKVTIPLLGGAIAWVFNQHEKRAWEYYVRKEKHYEALLRSLRGFLEGSADRDLRAEFLERLNICWLYCPDEVIRKGYTFLATMRSDACSTAEERERACGEFIAAIRRDLISREPVEWTALEASEFKLFKPN